MGILSIGKRAIGLESQTSRNVRFLRAKQEEDLRRLQLEKDKDIISGKTLLEKKQQQRISKIQQTGFELGKQLGGFQPPQEDFSFQEQVLRQTVGGRGDKIWGTIGEPVTIHNDLNPRQRGDTSTGEIFGLNKPMAFGGGDRETRGMFGF